MTQLQHVVTARCRLGESPIWETSSQMLYWTDIYNRRIHYWSPSTDIQDFFEMDEIVSCFAFLSPELMIYAGRKRIAFFDIKSQKKIEIMNLEIHLPENRFNDGKIDGRGRFWFGSMSLGKKDGKLYQYDIANKVLKIMQEGIEISNGLDWSKDGTQFYHTDSGTKKIFVYDYDEDEGRIFNRRILVDLSNELFSPDGLTVDAEDNIWSAMWDGSCVIRYNPAGIELDRFYLPVKRPTSCAIGGLDLSTLYITTASVGLSEDEIDRFFQSGDIFSLDLNLK
jgi:sugar lactone lactonase YvrE